MNIYRKIGEECNINPSVNDVTIKYLTVEEFGDNSRNKVLKPSVWFEYNQNLYYCIFDYEFQLFETYDDWDDFDSINPSYKELYMLFQLDKTFIKVNPEVILNNDLGEFCQFEINFIKEYL